ncbi:SRPBCC domain-containing protein [Rhodoligotrophos ferricapiens]|uniref:SRPBCC domain-containing protein n=1 Tax=Rhodoligotrophos ferricapiens TaxID=3069264 RepID=UPI00315D93C8
MLDENCIGGNAHVCHSGSPEENRSRADRSSGLTLAARELCFRRLYGAPCAAVWAAWTDPRQLALWWGPRGITIHGCEVDLRPGGRFHMVMRDDRGREFPHSGVFLEILPLRRLVFTDAYEVGWVPSVDLPFMTAVVAFEDLGSNTRVIVQARHWTPADREAHERMGFVETWSESADKLAAYLA